MMAPSKSPNNDLGITFIGQTLASGRGQYQPKDRRFTNSTKPNEGLKTIRAPTEPSL